VRGALAPPALGMGPNFGPVQVLSSAGVSCLQLEVPRGNSLGAAGHGAIGLLSLWHAVLRLGGAASCPSPSLHPLLLRHFPLEGCQGSREQPVGV